ncbi:MAG: AAA family ATPase [Thermoplasmata archaeon]
MVGMPGSGKEEFAIEAEKHGYEIVRMGDTVRNYVRSLGLPMENSIVGKIASEERAKKGMDVWARRTIENIHNEKTVVDGIRNIEEIQFFKNHLKEKFIVVGIFANEKNRYDRIKNRNRPDDPKTLEEFKERDRRELSWGLATVFILADMMLVNTESLAVFRSDIRKLLRSMENYPQD